MNLDQEVETKNLPFFSLISFTSYLEERITPAMRQAANGEHFYLQEQQDVRLFTYPVKCKCHRWNAQWRLAGIRSRWRSRRIHLVGCCEGSSSSRTAVDISLWAPSVRGSCSVSRRCDTPTWRKQTTPEAQLVETSGWRDEKARKKQMELIRISSDSYP